jgi:predicted metal-dependent HD superfamily phosphohydrolase
MQLVLEAAERRYGDLPYHNWRHATTARGDGLRLAERCRKYNVPINAKAVEIALLFHDADYAEDHAALGFPSKEALSAHVAGVDLLKIGYPLDFIGVVKSCILATHRDAVLTTNEQKATRAADLAQMAAPYEVFRYNSDALRKEHEILTGKPLSAQEWVDKTRTVVGFYLGQDIRLTPEHDDESGRSVFHTRVMSNLERYLMEAKG